ncbi:hypothetical protein [Wolbachia endosymbiont of Chironomus riparius]|nr:hypothetical protein [Wolbachia endosymbiont of Chironomus riparius]
MEKQCIEQEILSLASKTSKELRKMYGSASQSKVMNIGIILIMVM